MPKFYQTRPVQTAGFSMSGKEEERVFTLSTAITPPPSAVSVAPQTKEYEWREVKDAGTPSTDPDVSAGLPPDPLIPAPAVAPVTADAPKAQGA